MFIKNKKEILLFIVCFISYFIYPSDEFINIEGAWASVEICKWMMENNNFNLSIRDDKSLKWEKNDGFIIEFPKKNKKGLFGLLGISNPWLVDKISINNNKVELISYQINYYYDEDGFHKSISDDMEIIDITIIDNDEVVFDRFSYPKGTHFYRISRPANKPIKLAVINDSNVRLRVKPNLNCDTWTKLQKETQVKIKDKSKEKFEIDGEKWYWYYVDADNLPDGWVYGKYLDIKK